MTNKTKSKKCINHCLSSGVMNKYVNNALKKDDKNVKPIPTIFGATNFFSSCSNSVCDSSGWIECDFPFGKKGSISLFKECGAPYLDNWDLRVLVFLSCIFPKSGGFTKPDDNSFLDPKKILTINFKMSEICKFWGVENSDSFFKEKIKSSLRKLAKYFFKLEGSVGDEEFEHYNTVISGLSILRKKYDKDSVRVVCRINEWAILACSSSFGFVNVRVLKHIIRNKLGPQLLMAFGCYRQKEFVDTTDRIYLGYKDVDELRYDFMKRLRCILRIFKKIGVIDDYSIDKKQVKVIISNTLLRENRNFNKEIV